MAVRRRLDAVFGEEIQHGSTGVRTARLDEGAGDTAARPCMANAVQQPLFENRSSANGRGDVPSPAEAALA